MEDQNIKSQDTHQEYYDNRLQKRVFQINFLYTFLLIAGIAISTIWFTGNTVNRINNLEDNVIQLKETDKKLEDQQKVISNNNNDSKIATLKNIIIMTQNLKRFMEQKGFVWREDLPTNFEDILKSNFNK